MICPARAMLHLHGHDERVNVMRTRADALVPGGRFAWNAFVFDPAIAAEIDGRLARGAAVSGDRSTTTSTSAGST